jgi:hypothetical protein
MIRYEMPKEVRNYVLKLQVDLKCIKNNGKFSQQQTISHIIKEHKKMVEEKK